MTDRHPFTRPSVYAASACLGCAVVAARLGVDIQARAVQDGAWYVSQAVVVAMTALFTWHGLGSLIGAGAYGVTRYVEWRDERERMPRLPLPESPAQLEAQHDDEPGPEQPDEAAEFRWRAALRIFFTEGDLAGGFSYPRLKGVVGSDGHERLTHFYRGYRGLLVDYPGNRGHAFGPGWTLVRVLALIERGALAHPNGLPPEVHPRPHFAARRSAAQSTPSSEAGRAVIEQ